MSQSGAEIGFLSRALDEQRLGVLLEAIGRDPVSDEMLTLATELQDAAQALREAGVGKALSGPSDLRYTGDFLSRRSTGSMAQSRLRSPKAARGHG